MCLFSNILGIENRNGKLRYMPMESCDKKIVSGCEFSGVKQNVENIVQTVQLH